jgi:histidinol-phosphate phosphatase family protein
MIPFTKIREEGTWTLFLDRDGTINKRLPKAYVNSIEQFEFLPGVLDSIKVFSQIFKHIIIVTNQQGIGKELMTTEQLTTIHDYMNGQIMSSGGYIDQIYHCPHLEIENPTCRKPNPGMAIQAAEDFPDIVFKKSLMVGDMMSDILFGQQLDMYTILVNSPSYLGNAAVDDSTHAEMASLNEIAQYLMA